MCYHEKQNTLMVIKGCFFGGWLDEGMEKKKKKRKKFTLNIFVQKISNQHVKSFKMNDISFDKR